MTENAQKIITRGCFMLVYVAVVAGLQVLCEMDTGFAILFSLLAAAGFAFGLILLIPNLPAVLMMILGLACGLVIGVWRALASTWGERADGGGRLWYFHWSGGWLDGWKRRPSSPPPSEGTLVEDMLEVMDCFALPTYFALRTPVMVLLCAGRAVAAVFLRFGTRLSGRTVHECRICHGWTDEASWRCPGCGRLHRGMVPSAKHGLFAWQCECGARLPTLDRRRLAAVCSECGGAMDPVERGRADVAFLGASGTGEMRHAVAALSETTGGGGGWREESPVGTDGNVATLVSENGRHHLRMYDTQARAELDAAELVQQRYWGHIGAVVVVVDPVDSGSAERVWESWLRVMEREHPGRVRRMACAVVLTKTDESAATGLPPGAGDRQCRAFLERAGAGNLLNGLDGQFRKVRVFAPGQGGAGKTAPLWSWVSEQAFLARL